MKDFACTSSHFVLALIVGFSVFTPPRLDAEEEVGFIETFALAKDRAKAISDLIPGTDDYYYFSALLAQQEGKLDQVDALLEPWISRQGNTPKVNEIRNRQALLRYATNPAQTLKYLTDQLGLAFQHEQQRLDSKPDFPTSVQASELSAEVFQAKAFQRIDLSGVTDGGLDALLRNHVQLTPVQRRDLLSRLRYPDHEQLVSAIAADLRTPESPGFGGFGIHRKLTLSQLDELLGMFPELVNHSQFVETKIQRLAPSEDESRDRDPEVARAYLDRLWSYVQTLPISFASLKASVLYQRLTQAQSRGEYPRDEFIAYLELPRAMPYMKPEYLREQQQKGITVDLNQEISGGSFLPRIGSDEELVRAYLEHFFAGDENYTRFSPLILETYLKQVFAETKLLRGVGDPARWYSMLSPLQVQQLKDRIEISFSPSNQEHYLAGEGVTLTATLKNVKELMVKVYEINALNFYQSRGEEINTDLNLDGLVANEETLFRYEETSVRQHVETFAFDSLQGRRGIWVVELIGNGISSRALIRKGKLQYLSRDTVGGALLTVLDEENRPVKASSIRLGGKRYDADEKGFVLLPFSESGTVSVILSDGELATLAKLELPRETYDFTSGILLEQETLLPGTESSLVVRPVLSLNGEPVSLSNLKEVHLTVTTTDLDGIASMSESKDFPLFDDHESVHTFRVPDRLSRIAVELTAEIPLVTKPGEKAPIRFSTGFEVNGIDAQGIVADSFLSRIEDHYVVQVLGKTGEPIPERPVQLRFSHPDFVEPVSFTRKTTEEGRIDLGPLEGISSLSCTPDQLPERTWKLEGDRVSLPQTIHAKAGDVIEIPIGEISAPFSPNDFAIFETRSGNYISDQYSKAAFADGVVTLTGLFAGDYDVVVKASDRILKVKVTEAGAVEFGYALSANRHLQLLNQKPLQISALERRGDRIVISVLNADEQTRVHLVATRFLPEFDPFTGLDHGHRSAPLEIRRGSNATRYVSGRDIGEEYRYILERRGSVKFPGNMLSRPGLLLNPWELNETSTTIDEAAAGEDYRKSEAMAESQRKSGPAMPAMVGDTRAPGQGVTPALHFLRQQGVVIPNLKVGENGTLAVDLAALGDRQYLQVVAVNHLNTVSRQLSLPEPKEGVGIRDLRLKETLDPAKDFTERRKVTLLKAGEVLRVADFRASEVETYDTVAGIYGTLAGINADETFTKFGFLATWIDLEETKKRELYSEFACHELQFFLSRKDPAFFEKTILPYLKNKKNKTFLDFYLIGADLSNFLQPWEFSRLNIVERILLSRRIGEEERARTASHVVGLLELLPPDPERDANVYLKALRGKSSETSTALGILAGATDGFANDHVFVGAGGGAEKPTSAPMGGENRASGNAKLSGRGIRARSVAIPAEAVAAAPAAAPMMSDQLGFAPVMGGSDKELLEKAKQLALYRVLESTRELAENNYYHLPIADQNAALVEVNGFWKDFAIWNGKGGFYSREFPAATRNFTEMMFVLSVLDLPFTAEKHGYQVTDNVLEITAASPLVVFHQEIQEAHREKEALPILVSQNFLRADDRFRIVEGQQVDKFVSDEFLTGVVYLTQVVATNPTSSAHRLDLLVQIPEGAVPVSGSDYIKSYPTSLGSFSTQSYEVQFYFPKSSGDASFRVYPVRVAMNEKVIAAGADFSFKVVDRLTRFDEASWEYLSQFGSTKEVFDYLATNNLHRIDLSRIAWRAREDVDFLRKSVDLIGSRHAYDETLWSYGIHHNVTPVIREYLKHREDFLSQCGRWIDCELVSLDPIERNWYQHLEYSPLVNARTHPLGRERKILNNRFREQYGRFLEVTSYKPQLSAEDRLGVTAYLSLQDRVQESLAWFDSIDLAEVESRLQYDYLKAYLSFYRNDIAAAGVIAANYADYPVDHWREKFAQVSARIREIEGGKPEANDATREQQLETLSAKGPFLELSALGRSVKLSHRNVESVVVNYYEMDLEFLFSSKPFVSGESGQFRFVKPNRSEKVPLAVETAVTEFVVPEEFASRNVLVEVVGAGETQSLAIYSNTLKVQLSPNYGQIEVRREGDNSALSSVYVKVYARMKNGEVRFLKDGYTDLRGKFDYVSLSTNEIEEVSALALLVMSEKDGSVVKEVAPPQR